MKFRPPIALPLLMAALTSLSPAAAHAQQAGRGVLVYGVAGTGGVGLGMGMQLSERWVVRGELARLKRDIDRSDDRIDYGGQLKLGTGAILADYHPFDGAFRITGGVDFGRPRANLRALTKASILTVNDRDYLVPPGEGLTAELKYPRAMPYLGIGWGYGDLQRPGWRFGLDLGASFGRARGQLNATQGLMSVAGFPDDLAAQNRKFDEDARKLRFFPIVKVGVGYAF